MKKILSMRMEYQIGIAIVLSIVTGLYAASFAADIKILGTIYLGLLKFIIAPLLFFSIISSIIGIGSMKEMGKLGGLTFGIYMMTTVLAITISLLMMNLFTPGDGVEIVMSYEAKTVQTLSIEGFLMGLIPSNIVKPFLEGNMMQLVFISIVMAMATLAIDDKEGRERLHVLTQTITDVVLKFTSWIIALTPIGVYALVANVVAVSGLQPLLDLWQFVLVVLTSLGFHLLVTLPLLAYILAKINVYTYLLRMRNVILFAFSTASSAATLPLNMSENIKKGGVHKRIAELVLPIGSTINMDGTALYQAAVALFVAQALQIDLTLMQQITVAITVVLASVGAAGIPGAGIVMLTTVFATIGLPIEAIGIIMLVDRVLDMFRTAVNVSGDMIVTKIINQVYDKDLKKPLKA